MRVLYVPWNLTEPVEIRDVPDDEKLASCQALVGGWVEEVRTQILRPNRTLLCDENFRFKHGSDEAINSRAMWFSGYAGLLQGDCILIGQTMTSEGPDWGDWPEATVAESLDWRNAWPL